MRRVTYLVGLYGTSWDSMGLRGTPGTARIHGVRYFPLVLMVPIECLHRDHVSLSNSCIALNESRSFERQGKLSGQEAFLRGR
jgi:hypothetical protein